MPNQCTKSKCQSIMDKPDDREDEEELEEEDEEFEEPRDYNATLSVPNGLAKKMERYCEAPRPGAAPEQIVFRQLVTFEDGKFMVIQVITELDPSKEACRSVGLMYDIDGQFMGEADSDGTLFLGQYTWAEEGGCGGCVGNMDTYTVNVLSKK